MKNNNFHISLGRMILMVFMLMIVVVGGTFAWFTFSSKQSALVLTIGNINNTQITLTPYQVKEEGMTPVNTYTSGVSSDVIIKNNEKNNSVALYYKINQLDQNLINNGLKYTIINTSDGSTVKTGGFESVTEGQTEFLIYESNNIDTNSQLTYRVYLWVENLDKDQSSIAGSKIDMELNGAIGSVEIVGNNMYGETLTMNITDFDTYSSSSPSSDYTFQWYLSSNQNMSGDESERICNATSRSYTIGSVLTGTDTDCIDGSKAIFTDKYIYALVTVNKDGGTKIYKDLTDSAPMEGEGSDGDADNGSDKVLPKPITVTSGGHTKTYDGNILKVSSCSGTGLLTEQTLSCVMTIDSEIIDAGTKTNEIATVSIKYDDADIVNNYNITKVNGILTVNKKSVDVSWDTVATPLVYNGYSQAPTASVDTGVDNEIIIINKTEGINVGNYTSTVTCASVSGGQGKCSNYTLTNTTKDFSIGAKEISVMWENKTEFIYNGLEQAPTASVTTGIDNETMNVSVSTDIDGDGVNDAINVGTYTATASCGGVIGGQAKCSNYILKDDTKTKEFNIVIKEVTITANSNSKIYDGTALTEAGCTITATGEGNANITGHTVTCTMTSDSTITNVGTKNNVIDTVKIMNGTIDVTNNFDITKIDGALTINPKEVSVVWGDVTRFEYNGNGQAPTAGVDTGVTGDTMTVSRTTGIDAGDYTSTASCANVNGDTTKCNNYTLTNITKDFIIDKKTLTPTATANDKTYDGNTSASGIVSLDGTDFTSNGMLTATCTFDNPDVGDGKAVTCSNIILGSVLSKNYQIDQTSVTTNANIIAKSITVTWGNTIFTYNGNSQIPTVTTPVSGVGEEKISLAVSGAGVNVGNYTATASCSSVTGGRERCSNYTIDNATIDFTINKADATCSIESISAMSYPGINGTADSAPNTGKIKYTYVGDGAFSVISTDLNVISVGTINSASNEADLTAKKVGTTTITISGTGGTNYNDCTASQDVQVEGTKYIVTLDQTDATTTGSESVVATFGSAMPNITLPSRNGWSFDGYSDASSVKYYNADGTSARNYDYAGDITLYTKWVDTVAPSIPSIITMYELRNSRVHSLNDMGSGAMMATPSEGTNYHEDYYAITGENPSILFENIDTITGINGAYIGIDTNGYSVGLDVFYEVDDSFGGYESVVLDETGWEHYVPFSIFDYWDEVEYVFYNYGAAQDLIISNLAVSAPNNQWNRDNILLILSTVEEGSGLGSLQYTYSDSATETGTDATMQWVHLDGTMIEEGVVSEEFSAEMNRYVYVRACDNAGNCSDKSSTYIKIDKTSPWAEIGIVDDNASTIRLNFNDNFGISSYYFGTSKPTVDTNYTSLSSEEASSGSLSKNISTSGTYYFSVKDYAGNVTTVSKNIVVATATFMYLDGSTVKSTTRGCISTDNSGECSFAFPEHLGEPGNGFDLDGWTVNTAADTGVDFLPGSVEYIVDGLVFYGLYSRSITSVSGLSTDPLIQTANQYYNASGDISTVTLPTTTLGGSFSNPVRAIDGWNFAGWRDDDEADTSTMTTYTPAVNVKETTVYAVYSRYIYMHSGYSSTNKITDSVLQYYNVNGNFSSVTLVEPVAELVEPGTGGSFSTDEFTALGWRDDNNNDVQEYDIGASYSPTVEQSINLYAVYSRTIPVYSGINKVTDSDVTQYYNTYNDDASGVDLPELSPIDEWTSLGYRTDTGANISTFEGNTSIDLYMFSSYSGFYAVYSKTQEAIFYSGINKSTVTNVIATAYYNTNSVSLPTNVYINGPGWDGVEFIDGWYVIDLGWSDSTEANGDWDFDYRVGTSRTFKSTPYEFYALYERDILLNQYGDDIVLTQYYNSSNDLSSVTLVTPTSHSNIYPYFGAGWRDDTLSGGVEYDIGAVYTPAVDEIPVNFYAVYTKTVYVYSGINKATTAELLQYYYFLEDTSSSVDLSSIEATPIDNYTFVGWTTSSDDGSGTLPTLITNNALSDHIVSVYAVYERTQNFKFYSGVNKSSVITKTVSAYYNTNSSELPTGVNISNATYDGLASIDGWDIVGFRNDTDSVAPETVSGNLAFSEEPYEYYTVYKRVVNIIFNGGVSSFGNLSSIEQSVEAYYNSYNETLPDGCYVTVPSKDDTAELGYGFTKAGYSSLEYPPTYYALRNWYDTSIYVSFDSPVYYEINYKSVEFKYFDGSIETSILYYNALGNSSVETPVGTDIDSDWIFAGWVTEDTHDANNIPGGATHHIVGTYNDIFYAIYKRNFTVTYHGNADGVTNVPSQVIYPIYKNALSFELGAVSDIINISSTVPIRTGHKFLYWQDSNANYISGDYLTWEVYTDNDIWNTDLYAVWEEESTVASPSSE